MNKVLRWGMRPGPQKVSREQVREIVRLRDQAGWSFKLIARKVGGSHVAVFKKYHKWVLWAREEEKKMRERLPSRRGHVTFTFQHTYPGALTPRTFTAHAGYYTDGRLGEVWVSLVDGKEKLVTVDAHDTCIAVSFALQHGADLSALSRAMLRGSDSTPHGFLGSLIDALTKLQGEH